MFSRTLYEAFRTFYGAGQLGLVCTLGTIGLVHWSVSSLVNRFTGQLIHCFADINCQVAGITLDLSLPSQKSLIENLLTSLRSQPSLGYRTSSLVTNGMTQQLCQELQRVRIFCGLLMPYVAAWER